MLIFSFRFFPVLPNRKNPSFFYLNGFIRATIGDNDDGIVAINEIC